MKFTLNQAAKEAQKAKSTILAAIKDGSLSAPKDSKGRYQIDPSELFRVFPKTGLTEPYENRTEPGVIERLRAELEGERRLNQALIDQVDDLKARLDSETEERRAATRLLTDEASRRMGLFSRLFGR